VINEQGVRLELAFNFQSMLAVTKVLRWMTVVAIGLVAAPEVQQLLSLLR
jgi:hypothetical protein